MNDRAAGALRAAGIAPETSGPRFPDVSMSEIFASVVELIGALPELAGPQLDSSDLRNRDPELLRRIAPLFYAIGKYYFRGEGEGLENLPRDEQFIAVGNHSGPPLIPDVWVAGAWWMMEIGVEHPVYILVHDVPLRIPVLGNLMMKAGCLRASRENAEKVLASGASLLVFPGGDAECMRSFWNRNRIDLRGHTGFIELAFRHGVPILPMVNVGGQEVYFTLFSGERLARLSGLERLTRVQALPLIAGLPWGLWLSGFVPYLPLPAKLSYAVAPPIRVERDPERARDRAAVRRVYGRVTGIMQDMVDELASRRRFPVIG
jgi:1-acyl-sn-glycerol-3-phosphate acyltransferase